MVSGSPLNILDYGATDNNSATGIAAMTAALAALGQFGGEIYIPTGFTLNLGTMSFIFPVKNVVIRGGGPSSVITSGVTTGNFVFTTKAGTGAQFVDFSLLLTSTGNGIQFVESRQVSLVSALFIEGFGQTSSNTAIYATKATTYSGFIRIEKCYITAVQYGINFGDDVTTMSIHANNFIGPQESPRRTDTRAINIDGLHGGSVSISSNEIEGWGTGIYISEGASYTITNNNFETNNGHDITITDNVSFVAVTGNQHTNYAQTGALGLVSLPVSPTNVVFHTGPYCCDVNAIGYEDMDFQSINSFNSIGQITANTINVGIGGTSKIYIGYFTSAGCAIIKVNLAAKLYGSGIYYSYAELLAGGTLSGDGTQYDVSVLNKVEAGAYILISAVTKQTGGFYVTIANPDPTQTMQVVATAVGAHSTAQPIQIAMTLIP